MKIQDYDLISFSISRVSVENKNYSQVNKLIKLLRSGGSSSRQKLGVSFDGYEYDIEEIFEIDNIRKYVKVLLFRHPSLLYYISNIDESLQNLLVCYFDFETIAYGEKKPIVEYPIEDLMYKRQPRQKLYIYADQDKLDSWFKEIRKEAMGHNDVVGGELVINTIKSLVIIK